MAQLDGCSAMPVVKKDIGYPLELLRPVGRWVVARENVLGRFDGNRVFEASANDALASQHYGEEIVALGTRF